MTYGLVFGTLVAISQLGVEVRSFSLTRNRLSLSIARKTPRLECASTVGVDRNLRNLTVGNDEHIHHYDLSKDYQSSRHHCPYRRLFQTGRC
ncbi:hypothetical protein AUI46_01025 [archaeon 13_1_40CM_2_52_13]|nr:MAG: hypothetical protein AUI46_01025 [archaeon 13_1_40CM_2_52_13]